MRCSGSNQVQLASNARVQLMLAKKHAEAAEEAEREQVRQSKIPRSVVPPRGVMMVPAWQVRLTTDLKFGAVALSCVSRICNRVAEVVAGALLQTRLRLFVLKCSRLRKAVPKASLQPVSLQAGCGCYVEDALVVDSQQSPLEQQLHGPSVSKSFLQS